jgi:hypothetical protein
MTDWAALQHAYGDARDVPGLLIAAENSGAEFGPAWDEVWSRLCHQGTVYTASYAALPLLADMAERHASAGYIAALDLASAIVASTDGPTDSSVVRQEYSDTVTRLRALAEQNLALAKGDVEFVYGLQALMAFEDGGVWQRYLNHVADGELPVECPKCREFLILDLEVPSTRWRTSPTTRSRRPPCNQRTLKTARSADGCLRCPGVLDGPRSPHG